MTILKIRNRGPAPAREVSYHIEGIMGGTPTVVYESVRTPIPLLDPGGERRVALQLMQGSLRPRWSRCSGRTMRAPKGRNSR